MIPKIIWQTYKTKYEDLPERAATIAGLWQVLNPEYEYRYMDDEDMFKFVEEHYGLDMLNLMKSFKVPVMMADLWRILVIYEFGGVYADLDARPTSSIFTWVDEDKDFVVGIEDGVHYTQWAFMAKPHSPIIKSVLDVMMERCKNVDYEMKEFVHYHTGPKAFTDGIRRYLGLPDLAHECLGLDMINMCLHGLIQNETLTYHLNETLKKEKFYCFGGTEWDTFRKGHIVHEFASVYWDSEKYQSWTKHPLINPDRGKREQ